jgi:hypothetical protein
MEKIKDGLHFSKSLPEDLKGKKKKKGTERLKTRTPATPQEGSGQSYIRNIEDARRAIVAAEIFNRKYF